MARARTDSARPYIGDESTTQPPPSTSASTTASASRCRRSERRTPATSRVRHAATEAGSPSRAYPAATAGLRRRGSEHHAEANEFRLLALGDTGDDGTHLGNDRRDFLGARLPDRS